MRKYMKAVEERVHAVISGKTDTDSSYHKAIALLFDELIDRQGWPQLQAAEPTPEKETPKPDQEAGQPMTAGSPEADLPGMPSVTEGAPTEGTAAEEVPDAT